MHTGNTGMLYQPRLPPQAITLGPLHCTRPQARWEKLLHKQQILPVGWGVTQARVYAHSSMSTPQPSRLGMWPMLSGRSMSRYVLLRGWRGIPDEQQARCWSSGHQRPQ